MVNEVDGLEGQEELCFVNANGTWYKKEPHFQYQNNYQQKPFYNNQQSGYQAGKTTLKASSPKEISLHKAKPDLLLLLNKRVALMQCQNRSWSPKLEVRSTLDMS